MNRFMSPSSQKKIEQSVTEQMHSVLDTIRCKTECRTPIVVYEEACNNDRNAAVDRVKRISLACDTHLDVLHCDADDQLVQIGKKIDATIINGDWLLLTFSSKFTTADFLRLVGRRLFTIMPDVEKKPNIELFRLWLCLSQKHIQPAVFRQIAVDIDLSHVLSAASQLAAVGSAVNRADAADNDQPAAPPPTRTHDIGLPQGVRVEDYEAIPVDDSAGDADTAFDVAQQFAPPHHDAPPPRSTDLASTKVGVMFYRRLELATGRRPMSSTGRAAELRQLRHSANPLRQPTKHPLRPLTAGGEASPNRRPAHDAEVRINPAVELRTKFEKRSSDTLQQLHTLLLRSFGVSQESGERLLQLVEQLAQSAPAAAVDGASPVASSVDFPSASPKDLLLSDVLREADGIVLRLGTWAGTDVLVQQHRSEKFDLDLARIQFSCRHPTLFSPLALARENTSSEYSYLLFPKPAIGPIPLVLRKLPNPASLSLQYVGAVARCVAVALSQLHSLGIVHRDVAASNVMDMGSLTLTLAVTNRCRRCEPGTGSAPNDVGIAVRWTSPDALFTQRYTPADDVWALGVLLWEVLQLCREAPFSSYVLKEDVATALARGETPSRPPGCPENFWRRIVSPCFFARARRPQLSQIVAELDVMMPSL